MAQQTLLRPSRQTPEETKEQTSQRAPKQPQQQAASHRRPRTPGAAGRRTRRGEWRWAAVGLVVAFVLSLLAGALLGVHGPSGSSSAGGPSVILQPEAPATPAPAKVEPQPAKKPAEPAKPGKDAAGPAGTRKVTLKPGDTLYALARTHDTTVKTLQRLNDLGSSTLIYAGKTLRVPSGPNFAPDSSQSPKATPPASAATPDVESTQRAKRAVRPAPNAVISYARAQLGKPYIWGGTGPRGYDCSGLVMRAWEAAGVKLPRTTWGQIHAGAATTRARLVPGDLVLSYGGGHVALYIGKGKVIHAPQPGSTVTVAPLPEPSDVVGYRHITR